MQSTHPYIPVHIDFKSYFLESVQLLRSRGQAPKALPRSNAQVGTSLLDSKRPGLPIIVAGRRVSAERGRRKLAASWTMARESNPKQMTAHRARYILLYYVQVTSHFRPHNVIQTKLSASVRFPRDHDHGSKPFPTLNVQQGTSLFDSERWEATGFCRGLARIGRARASKSPCIPKPAL